MKIKLTAFLAMAALFLLSTGLARAAGPIEQLKQFVANTQSAAGKFRQVADPGGTSGGQTSSGNFAFARPGKFHWDVREPYPQLLVADGKQIFFHDPDLNQVTIRPMGNAIGATPAAILFGTGKLEDNFTVTDGGKVEGVSWLQAIPKVKDAGFERIMIGFRDGLPVVMDVLDAFNQNTRFEFTEFTVNPTIKPEMFQFKVPEGADVVRQ